MFGWGPLLGIIFLATIGLWPDPNLNPVGPGLLFFVTSWPAVICLGVGVFQVRRRRPVRPGGPSEVAATQVGLGADPQAGAPAAVATRASARTALDWRSWLELPVVRVVAALGGIGLTIYGITILPDGEGRGPTASILVGVAVVYWAFTGRIPFWFRR